MKQSENDKPQKATQGLNTKSIRTRIETGYTRSTGKTKKFFINSVLREALDRYIKSMSDHEYLFQSRNGTNQPLSRSQEYRVLNKAEEIVGLDNIGCHSTRKTFGYHHY